VADRAARGLLVTDDEFAKANARTAIN